MVKKLKENATAKLSQPHMPTRQEVARQEAGTWQSNNELTQIENFNFNISEALKSGCYVSGTTGTGKSDIGMYSAKTLMEHDVIVLAFDSTQDWLQRSSIGQIVTLRTPYIREIPQASTTFDISLLKILERQQLVERFCGDIYRYQAMKKTNERQSYFLIFEESQNYFKEGFMKAKRFSNSAMLLSEGRNYRVRFMCITQFASLLDKTVMKYMRLRFFGYSSEPNDCEYVSRFYPRNQREEIQTKLRNLKAGQFLNLQGNIVSIEPFSDSTVKKQVTVTPTTQTLPRIQTHADYGALIKFVAISTIGFAFLLGVS